MTDTAAYDPVEDLAAAIRRVLAWCDAHPGGVTAYGLRYGMNLPECLSHALTTVAEETSLDRLVEHRPGSWEADHVIELAWEAD